MIKLKINDNLVEAEEGLTLLEVIDEADYQLHKKRTIPRLCYNEALEPYASCRLCVVEVEKNGKTSIETSCNYKITPNLIVKTHSEKIFENRKTTIELLLAKAPGSEAVKDLAYRLGAKGVERYRRTEIYLENCIDCGLCARACEEIVGRSAITMAGRGTDKHATTPCNKASDECIGCGLCSYVCPTGAIKLEEKDGKRTIWGKEFELIKEGRYKLTKEQLEYIKNIKEEKKSPFKIEINEDICKNCERCVAECPQLLFSVAQKFNKKGFKPALWGYDKLDSQVEKLSCAGCKACHDTCPEAAIDIYTKKKNVRIL